MTDPDVAAIAEGLSEAQRATCPTCHGIGFWQSYPGSEEWPCRWCVVDETRIISLLLDRLSDEQKMFLMLGEDTLDYQTVTPAQWDGSLMCGFWIEDDDEIDLGDGLIWPATKHWFAASWARYEGDGGDWKLAFKYNANGLRLRDHIIRSERDA